MSEPMTPDRLEELRKGVAACKERGLVMSGVAPLEECIEEIDRLRGNTYCAYCGYEVNIDADASVISEHIKVCEKHPIRGYEAEINRLREQNKKLKFLVEVFKSTPEEEVEAALDAVDPVPLPKEQVERILHNVWKRIEESEAKDATP